MPGRIETIRQKVRNPDTRGCDYVRVELEGRLRHSGGSISNPREAGDLQHRPGAIVIEAGTRPARELAAQVLAELRRQAMAQTGDTLADLGVLIESPWRTTSSR